MFTDIKDFILFVESQKRNEKKTSLDRMRRIAEIYGNPQDKLQFIHIGGTNGKGSLCSFIENILIASGLNVGKFISPYIVSFNERITFNKQYISDIDLLKYGNFILSKYDYLDELGIARLSFFEFVTLLSFLYFKDKEYIDVVVLEVGIGGLLDSTNIVKNVIASAISNVNLDHMNILGNTIEEIALQKLGIVKQNVPFFTIQNDALTDLFITETNKKNSLLNIINFSDIKNLNVSDECTTFDYKELNNVKINLLGKYQSENAAIAIEICKYLNDNNIYKINQNCIYEGLLNTFWPGRLQVVSKEPLIIVDGAHNIDAINRQVEFIKVIKGNRKLKVYFAVSANKDKEHMISLLDNVADKIVFTEFHYKRSDEAINLLNFTTIADKSIEYDLVEAVNKSLNLSNDWIIIFTGSLYFVSEILKIFNK
ncbi:MAG: folylpolyglutamate synthase/dihydrofolate synthase family protein [Bacilli bacterium]